MNKHIHYIMPKITNSTPPLPIIRVAIPTKSDPTKKAIYLALIDTGANLCAISNEIIKDIDVFVSGTISNELIDGTKIDSPGYTCDMWLLDMEGNAIYSIFNKIQSSVIEMKNKPYQLIIGQNALDRLIFTYNGPTKEFCLDFSL